MKPRARFFVEGTDDAHFLSHWLRLKLGIDLRVGERIHPCGDSSRLIQQAAVVGKESGYEAVGFVGDADALKITWMALRAALIHDAEPVLAEDPLPDGSVVPFGDGRRLGVWLMPDNQRDGNIETFLRELRTRDPEQDVRWELALAATGKLPEPRAFVAKDLPKAELRTWLAWQREPGASYGLALALGCFDFDHAIARSFTAWLRRLYGSA